MPTPENAHAPAQPVADILFHDGAIQAALTAKIRGWLIEQLARYPERVHPGHTCSGGALQKLATCDYPFVVAELGALKAQADALAKALAATTDALGDYGATCSCVPGDSECCPAGNGEDALAEYRAYAVRCAGNEGGAA